MPFTQAAGVRIAYEHAGTGAPLVFLHGAQDHRGTWAAQMAEFSRDYHVAALDFRNSGESELTTTATWQDYALDVNAVLDALRMPRAHIVGLSRGGLIALQFYLEFPARVRSLTLADTVSQLPSWDPAMTARLGAVAVPTLVIEGDHDQLANGEDLARHIPGARLERLPGAGHWSHRDQPAAFNRALRAFLENQGA